MTEIYWTIEKIKYGFSEFYKENGRYPTATEVDSYPKLPSSKQIQRRFGGLPKIRKLLNLTGPTDFTKGEYSSERARKINKRSNDSENDVYKYLIAKFGEPFVHREYFFNNNKRSRTDFYVYYKGGNFSVDVFYPNSVRNLNLCLNSKLQSYKDVDVKYAIIFLMMNESIESDQIKQILNSKINKLKNNQVVLKFGEFKEFCDTKDKLSFR